MLISDEIKKILIKPIVSILTLLYLLRYGNIWKFKKHLQKKKPNIILLHVYDNYFSKYGSWIGYKSEFLSTPIFPHGPIGIFIANAAKIGSDVIIYHQVTIGSSTQTDGKRRGSPIIGNNVYIGAGAKIIGEVCVGNNCRIGANAVVYKDMPPNSVAVQAPTRIIQKEKLDNRYYLINKNGKFAYYNKGCLIVDENKKM